MLEKMYEYGQFVELALADSIKRPGPFSSSTVEATNTLIIPFIKMLISVTCGVLLRFRDVTNFSVVIPDTVTA